MCYDGDGAVVLLLGDGLLEGRGRTVKRAEGQHDIEQVQEKVVDC